MKNLSLVILFALVLLVSSGDGGNIGKIWGIVTDAASGCRLQGARVWISGTEMEVLSDTVGFYCIPNVPSGACTVEVAMENYIGSKVTDVQVLTGQTRRLYVSLQPRGTGTLRGRITHCETGDGIESAKICVFATGCRMNPYYTDTSGCFRVPAVPFGDCSLTVCHGLFTPQKLEVNVAAGKTVSVDFNLCPKRGGLGAIAGVVTDSATGEPLAGAWITRMPIPLYDTNDFESVRSDRFGEYSFLSTLPRTYVLVVSKEGYTTARTADVLVEVDEVSEVDVSLHPHPLPDTLGRICGIVVDASTCEPLPYANLHIHDVRRGDQADLLGFYCIPDVRPGTHTVTARYVGHATVEAPNVQALPGQTTILNFKMSSEPIRFK